MIKLHNPSIGWGLALLTALLVLPTSAFAEDDPLPDRLRLEIGVFFLNKIDTVVEFDRVMGPLEVGGVVDFNQTLGLQDSETVPRIDGFYRLGKRSSIDFSLWSIDLDGQTFLGTGIDFGNISIPVGEEVRSFYDQNTVRVSYRYSLYNAAKAEIAINAGLHVTSFDTGIDCLTCQTTATEMAGVTAPLPVVGFNFRYQISRRWGFGGRVEHFLIELGGFDGSLTDTRLDFAHQTFKNVGFGFGWNRIHTDIEIDTSEFKGGIDTKFEGLQAFVVVALGKAKYQHD